MVQEALETQVSDLIGHAVSNKKYFSVWVVCILSFVTDTTALHNHWGPHTAGAVNNPPTSCMTCIFDMEHDRSPQAERFSSLRFLYVIY